MKTVVCAWSEMLADMVRGGTLRDWGVHVFHGETGAVFKVATGKGAVFCSVRVGTQRSHKRAAAVFPCKLVCCRGPWVSCDAALRCAASEHMHVWGQPISRLR